MVPHPAGRSGETRELYWTSPRLTAAERDLGLVNQVLADDGFDEAALDWCHDLATRAPIAQRLMKENLNRAMTCDLATALDAEAANMVRTMRTADHAEAALAFVEKRLPNFEGR
ncbi:MAG: enoyl-CoA hydratase-related protein [Ilumatobacteraceae bacterium]